MSIPRFRRTAPLAPYAACFLATWGLLGLEPSLRIPEVAAAFGLQVLVGFMLGRAVRRNAPEWFFATGLVAFFASVALLRDGVGAAPGYGALLLLPVIWAGLRSRRDELGVAIAGAAVVLFAPLVVVAGTHYPPSGWRSGSLFIVVATVLGVTVLLLVDRLRSSEQHHRLLADTVERQRDEAKELLASQNALRRIATLVATGAEPKQVFHAVAEELASLFEAEAVEVVRFDAGAGVGEILGGQSRDGGEREEQSYDLAGRSAAARVFQTAQPARAGANEHSAGVDPHDLGVAISAPIFCSGRLWGAVGAAFAAGASIPTEAEERLATFAGLVAVAIANTEALEALRHRATTDHVTGIANHRTFHERLRSEVDRASRHTRALSLAVFDLDHFKQINDTFGHQAGDDVLAEVARRLSAIARSGDVIARIGGEEFAWLMPETAQEGAYLAAERARSAIEAIPFPGVGALTMSAGVCSNQDLDTAADLFRAADQALYFAKRNGRNLTSAPPLSPIS